VTPAVRLAAAEVRVGGRTILGPVDLTIASGERWALLGPNGSGKTTLLSLAGAWRQPSAGSVEVLGERLGRTDVRRLRRRIGHVSHAVGDRVRPSIPVEDLVLAGRAAALETWWQDLDDGDRAAARSALDRVGCGTLAARRVGTLSLGERARVLIARAMAGEPDLLLFDEPAAGLDLPGREQLLAAMADAAAPTEVLATHHLEELPPTTTHAALLRAGRVVGAGPIEATLTPSTMSTCFGIEVRVTRDGGRWSARGA
jgi:iron complex transport system ATP-binding protein